MDREAMSNDMGMLKSLLGLLNNPAITGASQPQPEAKEEPAKAAAPQAQTEFQMSTKRIFFTGATKAGKSFLAAQVGARVFELADPVKAMIRDVFGSETSPELERDLFAWGDGTVAKSTPLTPSRLLFVKYIRESKYVGGVDAKLFGTPNFWLASLAARVAGEKGIVAVTDVWDANQYKFLRQSGFTPFHVMCNNITRSGRGGSNVVSSLVTSIERDITNKVSQSPGGSKLWVVWSDDKYPPTSNRFLTVDDFVKGVTK